VKAVPSTLTGDKWLKTSRMYGAWLRLMECLRLWGQDIDFASNKLLVRDSKGARDRITMLHGSLMAPLQDQLKKVKAIIEPRWSDGWRPGSQIPQCSEGQAPAVDLSANHPFAMHLLEAGCDILNIQELPGHKDLSTTRIYSYVLNRGGYGVRSPVEGL
jgi:site-specific recombinase XerD